MAKDSESKNPFLSGSSDYIRPNAIFNPPNYRNLGVYVLLYNEIKGSLSDYGFSEHVTLDVFIDKKISDIIKIAKAIYENRRVGLEDSHGLDASKPEYKQALDWMGRLLPCSKGIEKDADGNPIMIAPGKPLYSPTENQKNIDELDNFLSNYEAVKAETQRVAGIMNKEDGMLSVRDARLLLDAKRTKVRQLYEYARANQDYKPGKIDKDGSPKSGIHAAAYFEAQNELSKKKRLLRRNGFFNFLKGAASVGCAAMMVVSGGALLSYGGFALTSIFGAVFSAAGVGASALGAVGAVFGFYGMKNFYKRWRKGMKKSFDMRLEIKDFIGPAYHGKDLEKFLAANWGKDGKNLTLNEKKTLFMFDRALKAYFELEGGKDNPKFPAELKMYLPDEVIKKWKLADDKKWFNYVSDKNGGFQSTLNNFSHVVQSLEGKGEHDHTEFLGILDRAIAPDRDISVAELANLSDQVDTYSSKIGTSKANERKKQLSNKLLSTIMGDVFENAYASSNLGMTQSYITDPRISKMIENSDTPNASKRISDVVNFLAAEERSEDHPLSSTVGVNIGAQYTTNPATIKTACQGLDSSVDSGIVSTIADAIGNNSYTTKQHFTVPIPPATDSIQTMIAGLPNGKVKNYLQFMYDKKVATVKNDQNSIETAVLAGGAGSDPANIASLSTAIAALEIKNGEIVSGTRTLADLRNWIMRPTGGGYVGLTPTEQKKATEMLDAQIESVERNEREQARAESFNILRNGEYSIPKGGKFLQIEEMIASIDAITYDKIKSADTKKLYEETILNVTPKAMSNYLKMQFAKKIETLFVDYIYEHSSELERGKDAVANIATFLADVQNNKFISAAQRERIIKAVEPKIELAFKTKLTDMEKLLLADVGKDEYKQILTDFYTKTYQEAGFVDYFNQNTASSNKILQRVEKLDRALVLKTLLSAGGDEEVPVIIDENSADTRSFLKIYFDESKPRNSSDPLLTALTTLQNISTTSNKSCLGKNDYIPATDGFIEQMTDFVDNNIKSGSLDDADKLAALLVVKKRTLAMFKLHMWRFIQGEANPSAYVTGAGAASLAAIKAKWQGLLNDIDSEYANLSAIPANSKYLEEYKGAQASVNSGTGSGSFVNFYRSKQLQPSL